jgi:hypothetical protein
MGSTLTSHLPIAATARCERVRGSLASVAALLGALLVGLTFACNAALANESGRCPNEALRIGPSENLPDCRAYELVTPAEKGRTQDMVFGSNNEDTAIPSLDGEHIALSTLVPLEPNASAPASIIGARAVFARTASGWQMKSVVEPGSSERRDTMELFSPNLEQVALRWSTELNGSETSATEALEVGPVGGPYGHVAEVPHEDDTFFLGANTGVVGGSPPFSDVLFGSLDHALPSSGVERALAEETNEGAAGLYDFTEGSVRVVNLTNEGTLLNRCGAVLGTGDDIAAGGGATGAVSADGSRIIFATDASGASCTEPGRLYMRVDGRETVEVSAFQDAPETERQHVTYAGATRDGSRVFFSTVTPLTAGETAQEKDEDKLFEYDSEEPEGERLKLVASGINPVAKEGPSRALVISEDGSTAYYEIGSEPLAIYHYDIATGESTAVATAHAPQGEIDEQSYTTPNGQFLSFVAEGGSGLLEDDGVAGEPRGADHNELYRYDAADGSVMCVSCGEGTAPAEGEMNVPRLTTPLLTYDETPPLISMSDNGQEVFFETTARLVPQDTNSTEDEITEATGRPGMDVYEWEASGAEEAPGVFCREVNGCTHMLSTGGDLGPSIFLGASSDGRNVFFATAARLVPQDTDEYTDIYDARVNGGFAPPTPAPECLSCQGVGSPAPLFSAGASLSFSGPGNPAAPEPVPAVKAKAKPAPCRRGYVKRKGRCVKQKAKKRANRSSVHVKKGGK